MAREKIHGRHCLRTGCNCDKGKADHAKYMRDLRAKKRAEKAEQEIDKPQLRLVNSPVVERIVNEAPAAPARTITVESDRPLGRVGAAVLLQVSKLVSAEDEAEHAAEIALAVALAGTVDDPSAEPKDRTAAARELRTILNGLKPTTPPAARQESAQELLIRRLAEPL